VKVIAGDAGRIPVLPRPKASVHVDERIADAARRQLDFPESGRPGASLARASLPRTPYVAAYLIDNDAVRILRVLHGAQIWSDEFTKDH